TLLFFLFNFNGHILSHLSVGHITWGGYFLFPWLVLLILNLLDGDKSWRWVLQFSVLSFLIFIQGSYHQYVWSLIFLGLIGLFSWRYFVPVLKGLIGAVLISMVRILPPALHALEGRFNLEFIGGYTHVSQIFEAMVTFKAPWEALDLDLPFTSLSWWEFDLFIGFLGLLALILGVVYWVKGIQQKKSWNALWLPMLLMTALSIGRVYNLLIKLQIPIFGGERVSSRLISIPFVFLLVLAAVGIQGWLNAKKKSTGMQIGLLVLLGMMINDIWQYIKVWQISNISANFEMVWVDLSTKTVANHPDPQYLIALWIGSGISLITLCVLWFLSRRHAIS
nr:hypothetical protein [Anaerolineaceae bacterium]